MEGWEGLYQVPGALSSGAVECVISTLCPPPSAFTQDPSSQEGERAFYKYNYKTVGINTRRQMDSSAETDRLDGEIK